MAIRVGTSGTTTKQVVVTGSVTTVKKVIVGTPVKKVVSGAAMSNMADVVVTGVTNGDLLIYSDASSKWLASKDLEEQNINGGSY